MSSNFIALWSSECKFNLKIRKCGSLLFNNSSRRTSVSHRKKIKKNLNILKQIYLHAANIQPLLLFPTKININLSVNRQTIQIKIKCMSENLNNCIQLNGLLFYFNIIMFVLIKWKWRITEIYKHSCCSQIILFKGSKTNFVVQLAYKYSLLFY